MLSFDKFVLIFLSGNCRICKQWKVGPRTQILNRLIHAGRVARRLVYLCHSSVHWNVLVVLMFILIIAHC